MSKIYLVTGALGHLGNTIVKSLLARGEKVRGLAMENDQTHALDGTDAELFTGDVCDPSSLESFFGVDAYSESIVIHTAGIVTITSKFSQKVYDINVGGTKNVIDQCRKHGITRLVHVSSVHAIPELPKGEVIREISHFDPSLVTGLYAKTKAEATQLVLDAARDGLDAVVVHPSGISGPGDYGRGHLTQLATDYMNGKLTACVKGGYDFVDVRDVAEGILLAAEKGRTGECYILSNQYYTVADVLQKLHEVSGHKRVKTVLPLWFAKMTAPLSEIYYRMRQTPPLYTRYSLYTLETNANFSHQKATNELGYATRPLIETLRDTIVWLRELGRLKPERIKADNRTMG